jgi:hypothetical protein
LNQCFSEKVCFPTIGSQEEVGEEAVIVVVIEEYYNATSFTVFIFFTTCHSFCRSAFTAQRT